MQITSISEASDPRLNDFRSLTDVKLRRVLEPEGGLYIAESIKVIERAIRAGHRVRAVLSQEKWLEHLEPILPEDTLVYLVSDEVAEAVTGYQVHRGALASMHRPVLPEMGQLLAGSRRVVVLEDIVDHTNVGAIFRAAAGLGADAVLISPRCADPLYRRSIRVSMGTVFQVPWTRMPEWHKAREIFTQHGFEVAALALADNAVSLDDYEAPEKLAIAFGTEGDGLSHRALGAADTVVTIPMAGGVDSLNVAAASALTIWALRSRG